MRAEVSSSFCGSERGTQMHKGYLVNFSKGSQQLSGTMAIRTLYDSQICLVSPVVCYSLLLQTEWHLTAQRHSIYELFSEAVRSGGD